ncbi:MAG: MlaD family protein [Rhodothermales bacterium]|nr:MlaD family protein [Rhodothermales bacterium]
MTRQTRTGLLVVAAACLFIFALFAIANRAFLFRDTFPIRSQFTSVAGLTGGAAVQYQGVNVGRVDAVQLPSKPGDKIEVLMAISVNARPVITKNTQAQIKSEGIVGDQIVVLVTPAGEVGDPIEDDDVVRGIDPFDLFEITDRALESVQNFEKAATTFDQIMQDVRNGEGTLGKIIYDSTLYYTFVRTANDAQAVMNSMADNAESLVALADEATQGVKGLLERLEHGEGTIARLVNDPELYEEFLSSADTLRILLNDVRIVLANFEQASNWGALGAYRFAELMEAAKHNWLFKRYFEERGHMEMAPFEVRERAIEESFRRLTQRERELLEWEERLRRAGAQVDLPANGRPSEPSESAAGNDTGAGGPTPAQSDTDQDG